MRLRFGGRNLVPCGRTTQRAAEGTPISARVPGIGLAAPCHVACRRAYGIGDLGPEAFAWIDRLHHAGQRWWQALPLGPTGYGNSPYQPLSSFAGSALIISPQSLNVEGLLDPRDYDVQFAPGAVDYASVIPFKERLLETAWNRFQQVRRGDLLREYEEFCLGQASWLEDYALFRALKARYGGACYIEWPAELVSGGRVF